MTENLITNNESQSTEAMELCPFCDAGAFISWDGDTDSPDDWSAVCDNTMKCGATIGGMSTESDARTAWNTRPRTPSVSEATVDDLQRELAFYFGAYHGTLNHRLDAAACMENECVRIRNLLHSPAASTVAPVEQPDVLVDEVQHRMDQVVEAAVEWHQAGREGGEWMEKADALSDAIDSLLELRDSPQANECFCGTDLEAGICPNGHDPVRRHFASPATPETDNRPSCWHCGVVLAYAPKLRCEDCPNECDVEGCDELGCTETGKETKL